MYKRLTRESSVFNSKATRFCRYFRSTSLTTEDLIFDGLEWKGSLQYLEDAEREGFQPNLKVRTHFFIAF